MKKHIGLLPVAIIAAALAHPAAIIAGDQDQTPDSDTMFNTKLATVQAQVRETMQTPRRSSEGTSTFRAQRAVMDGNMSVKKVWGDGFSHEGPYVTCICYIKGPNDISYTKWDLIAYAEGKEGASYTCQEQAVHVFLSEFAKSYISNCKDSDILNSIKP